LDDGRVLTARRERAGIELHCGPPPKGGPAALRSLTLAGEPLPVVDGVDLRSSDPARVVFAEGVAYGNEQQVAIGGGHALYRSPDDDFERVSVLDPTSHVETGTVDDAPTGLAAALDAHGPVNPIGEAIAGTAEIDAHLRALGYIE